MGGAIELIEQRVAALQRPGGRWIDSGSGRAALIFFGVFFLLVGWITLFPYTGDGDSILHFTAACESRVDPKIALSPWARPLHKLLLLIPAAMGIVPARLFQAGLTLALMWQTMRLARDLKFPRPELAGLFVIWQPYVFALGADTMTEIPFALGAVIAVRLWRQNKIAWSCLVVGVLPLVRPEGFFLAMIWAILLAGRLWNAKSGQPDGALREMARIIAAGMLGTVGMLSWAAACWLIAGHPLYFLAAWSWPVSSYTYYPSGPLLYYVYMWPEYCGLVLAPLFLIGIMPAARRAGMGLCWAIWSVVLIVHSVLFWGHWFASFGLIRIMATTSPITALVCYEGWIAVDRWLQRRRVRRVGRVRMAWVVAAAAFAIVFVRYWLESDHHRCFSIRDVAGYAMENGLVKSAPIVFAADRIFYVEVDVPTLSDRAIARFEVDAQPNLRRLAGLPSGSIGMWDNQISQGWYNVKIEQIQALGYEILHERRHELPRLSAWVIERMGYKYEPHRYVLLRKK